MTPEDRKEIAAVRASHDQAQAALRDALQERTVGELLGSMLMLARMSDWEQTLIMAATGPAWLRSICGMAVLSTLTSEVQRRVDEKTGESPQPEDE